MERECGIMTLEQRAEALHNALEKTTTLDDRLTILKYALRAVVEACAEVADRAEKDGEGMSPDYFLACSLVAERIRLEVGSG